MTWAASNTLFTVGFTVFVIAMLVLLVLIVRFVAKWAGDSRRAWLADQEAPAVGTEGPATVDPPQMTALVLGGGGTRGATQVGMLQVLAERGFLPDRIYGSSVGAINGAAFAGNPTVEGTARLTDIWEGIRGDEIFPQRRVHGPWQFLQQRESIHPNTGMRRIVEQGINFERLEDAIIPIEVVATSIVDGRERWLTDGKAIDAVMASAAIPAIFPPVDIDGDRLIDGGVVDNVPLARAIEAGATTIVVLLCGTPNYRPPRAKRPVESVVYALFIASHARFSRELAKLPQGVKVVVMSGVESASHDYTDFSETASLIAEGRAEAIAVLRDGGAIPGIGPTRTAPEALSRSFDESADEAAAVEAPPA